MEIKTSAVGTTFTVLGVLNLLVGAFGLLLLFGDDSSERAQGRVISISCLSGMLVCFAVASVLHFLCEIAHRLEMLQASFSPTQQQNKKTSEEPNKALEPTTTAVTSPAAQEPRQP